MKFFGYALLVSVFILFGAPFNPLSASTQVGRHLDPTSLLNPNTSTVSQLNNEFESYLNSQHINSKSSQHLLISQITEISSLETFIHSYIDYRSDFFQYLVFDHLATDIEIMQSRIDDCDGKAIVTTSLLLYRGYDAWVKAGPGHYWVEINLNNDRIHILEEEGSGTWYFKFNGTSIIYNWKMAVLLLSSYVLVIYLAITLSVGFYHSLLINTTYRTLLILVLTLYFGFITGYILIVE